MADLFRPTRYLRPGSLDEALQALAGDMGARLVAGGTLVMQGYDVSTSALVDLAGIGELTRVKTEDDGTLVLGAGLTIDRLGRLPELAHPGRGALREACGMVRPPAVRLNGTLGGNLVGSGTFGHLAPAMLALDAEVEVASLDGERRVPLAELYELGLPPPLGSLVWPGELVTAIRLPPALSGSWSGATQLVRWALDHFVAVVSARVDADGWAWAVGAAELKPRRLHEVEQACAGLALDDPDLPKRAAAAAADELDPFTDQHASDEYRGHIATLLVERLARRAADELGGGRG
jgi:CO/xanthine dehydrogenase FAD-binding subunit